MSLFTRTSARVPESTGPDERTIRIARKRFVRRQWARRWLAWVRARQHGERHQAPAHPRTRAHSTRMLRHLPWSNRITLSRHRVA